MADKIFFDTNAARNEGGIDHFLGNRTELWRFEKVADILLPDIVIDEVRQQKRRHLRDKRDQVKSNPFTRILGLDLTKTSDNDIEKFIQELEKREDIQYSVVVLKDQNLFASVRRLAINSLPPFESNGDKGFKDTCIYFTVLQYLEDTKLEEVFLVTSDSLLQSAFVGNKRVRVITNYDEYVKYREEYFRSDYFIEKLRNELGDTSISTSSIISTKLREDLSWEISLKSSSIAATVIIDFATKEIIDAKITHNDIIAS